jgi:protein-S-isoprenylcysteine O-methyltransferase Ste14
MKANTVSLINSLVLVSMGLWGYFESDSRPITALIPVIVGVILLLINNGVKKENKIAAHVAVLLTLLIIIGLVKPFLGTLDRGNITGILRVSLMILSSLWAMITFIQSFISARKSKA